MRILFRSITYSEDHIEPNIFALGSILEAYGAEKKLCLSMWDGCRFNQPAKNSLISNNKVSGN